MKTIQINIFQFSELSDQAKKRAREWYCEGQQDNNYFAESVYEDAASIAALMGLDIRQRKAKLMGGGIRMEPSIFYMGFWSQGDGACFEGTWRADDVKVGGVIGYAPQDAELHRIAKEFEEVAKDFPTGYFRVKHSGHYYHENCTDFSFEMFTGDGDDQGPSEDTITEAEDALKEAAKDFMRWIYKALEAAYDWDNADEQVDENIIANEYEFTEDGEVAR
jgi:hypothetical protein